MDYKIEGIDKVNYPTNWLSTKLEEFFRRSNGKNLTKEKMTDGEYLVYGGNNHKQNCMQGR